MVNKVSQSHTDMAEASLLDEFSTYAYWRTNIDKYKIYKNFAEESLTDLEDRIK